MTPLQQCSCRRSGNSKILFLFLMLTAGIVAEAGTLGRSLQGGHDRDLIRIHQIKEAPPVDVEGYVVSVSEHDNDEEEEQEDLSNMEVEEEEDEDVTELVGEASISVEKDKYREGETIRVDFNTGLAEPGTHDWVIGIYMHMAHPQHGDLPPICSIPVCAKKDCTDDVVEGVILFDDDHTEEMKGVWPLNAGRYGVGFDVHILDTNGDSMTEEPAFFHMDFFS